MTDKAGRGGDGKGGRFVGTGTAGLLGTLERWEFLGPKGSARSLGRGTLIADRCIRSGAPPLPQWNVNGVVAQSLWSTPGQRSPSKDQMSRLS